MYCSHCKQHVWKTRAEKLKLSKKSIFSIDTKQNISGQQKKSSVTTPRKSGDKPKGKKGGKRKGKKKSTGLSDRSKSAMPGVRSVENTRTASGDEQDAALIRSKSDMALEEVAVEDLESVASEFQSLAVGPDGPDELVLYDSEESEEEEGSEDSMKDGEEYDEDAELLTDEEEEDEEEGHGSGLGDVLEEESHSADPEGVNMKQQQHPASKPTDPQNAILSLRTDPPSDTRGLASDPPCDTHGLPNDPPTDLPSDPRGPPTDPPSDTRGLPVVDTDRNVTAHSILSAQETQNAKTGSEGDRDLANNKPTREYTVAHAQIDLGPIDVPLVSISGNKYLGPGLPGLKAKIQPKKEHTFIRPDKENVRHHATAVDGAIQVMPLLKVCDNSNKVCDNKTGFQSIINNPSKGAESSESTGAWNRLASYPSEPTDSDDKKTDNKATAKKEGVKY